MPPASPGQALTPHSSGLKRLEFSVLPSPPTHTRDGAAALLSGANLSQNEESAWTAAVNLTAAPALGRWSVTFALSLALRWPPTTALALRVEMAEIDWNQKSPLGGSSTGTYRENGARF